MLSRTIDALPPSSNSSSPVAACETNYVTVDYKDKAAATNTTQHHQVGGSLLRPLIGDDGVDPLINSCNTTTTRMVGGGRKEDGKGEKHGCRCGNATSTPGKLTCCGQRCPCYVNRSACLGCKCKGNTNFSMIGRGLGGQMRLFFHKSEILRNSTTNRVTYLNGIWHARFFIG